MKTIKLKFVDEIKKEVETIDDLLKLLKEQCQVWKVNYNIDKNKIGIKLNKDEDNLVSLKQRKENIIKSIQKISSDNGFFAEPKDRGEDLVIFTIIPIEDKKDESTTEIKEPEVEEQEVKENKKPEPKYENDVKYGDILENLSIINIQAIVRSINDLLSGKFGKIGQRYYEINTKNLEDKKGIIFGIYPLTDADFIKSNEDNELQEQYDKFKHLFEDIIVAYDYNTDNFYAATRYDRKLLEKLGLAGLSKEIPAEDKDELLKSIGFVKSRFENKMKALNNVRKGNNVKATNEFVGEANRTEYGPYLTRLLNTGVYNHHTINQYINDFSHYNFGELDEENIKANKVLIDKFNGYNDINEAKKDMASDIIYGVYGLYTDNESVRLNKIDEILNNYAELFNERKRDGRTDWNKDNLPQDYINRVKQQVESGATDEYLNMQKGNPRGVIIVYTFGDGTLHVLSKYDTKELDTYKLGEYGEELINNGNKELKLEDFDYTKAPIIYGKEFKSLIKNNTWTDGEVKAAVNKLFNGDYGKAMDGVPGLENIVKDNNDHIKSGKGNLTGVYQAPHKRTDPFSDLIIRYMQDENKLYALSRYDIENAQEYWITGMPSHDTGRIKLDEESLNNARNKLAPDFDADNYEDLSPIKKSRLDNRINGYLDDKHYAQGLFGIDDYLSKKIERSQKRYDDYVKVNNNEMAEQALRGIKKYTKTYNVLFGDDSKYNIFNLIGLDNTSRKNLIKKINVKKDNGKDTTIVDLLDALEEKDNLEKNNSNIDEKIKDINNKINESTNDNKKSILYNDLHKYEYYKDIINKYNTLSPDEQNILRYGMEVVDDNEFLNKDYMKYNEIKNRIQNISNEFYDLREALNSNKKERTPEQIAIIDKFNNLELDNKDIDAILDAFSELFDVAYSKNETDTGIKSEQNEKDIRKRKYNSESDLSLDQTSQNIIKEEILSKYDFDINKYKESARYKRELDDLYKRAEEELNLIELTHILPKNIPDEVLTPEEFKEYSGTIIDDPSGEKTVKFKSAKFNYDIYKPDGLLDKYKEVVKKIKDDQLMKMFKSDNLANSLLNEYIPKNAETKTTENEGKVAKTGDYKKLGYLHTILETPDDKEITFPAFDLGKIAKGKDNTQVTYNISTAEKKEIAQLFFDIANELKIPEKDLYDIAVTLGKAKHFSPSYGISIIIAHLAPLLDKELPKLYLNEKDGFREVYLNGFDKKGKELYQELKDRGFADKLKLDTNEIKIKDSIKQPSWIDDELIIEMIETRGNKTTVDKMADLLIELGSPSKEYNFTCITDCIKRNPWLNTRIEK